MVENHIQLYVNYFACVLLLCMVGCFMRSTRTQDQSKLWRKKHTHTHISRISFELRAWILLISMKLSVQFSMRFFCSFVFFSEQHPSCFARLVPLDFKSTSFSLWYFIVAVHFDKCELCSHVYIHPNIHIRSVNGSKAHLSRVTKIIIKLKQCAKIFKPNPNIQCETIKRRSTNLVTTIFTFETKSKRLTPDRSKITEKQQ